MERNLQYGLSVKLIGYVMAGVLLTSAAIGVLRVRNERGPLNELIDKAGQNIATATASGAASLVAGYDYGNLEILTANIAKQANVIRVIIRNKNGRVMTQAIGEKAGTFKHFESPVVFEGQAIGSASVDISNDTLEKALSALYWRVLLNRSFLARFSA